jgi:hypothetical protein
MMAKNKGKQNKSQDDHSIKEKALNSNTELIILE